MAEKAHPDYVQIATPLVLRGFRVTPVHPETKSGVMRNWHNHQATTPEEVLKHAKYYPCHNVGVVGKRGVGRHMFLDIDADAQERSHNRVEKSDHLSCGTEHLFRDDRRPQENCLNPYLNSD